MATTLPSSTTTTPTSDATIEAMAATAATAVTEAAAIAAIAETVEHLGTSASAAASESVGEAVAEDADDGSIGATWRRLARTYPFMANGDMLEATLFSFSHLLDQLARSILTVFPKDAVVRRLEREWSLYSTTSDATEDDGALRDDGDPPVPDDVPPIFRREFRKRRFQHKVILGFHETFGPFYADISLDPPRLQELFRAVDEAVEADTSLRLLVDLNLVGKWRAMSAKMRNTLAVAYLKQLCRYSNTYMMCAKLPPKLHDLMTRMMRSSSEQVERGESSFDDILTPESIKRYATEIFSGMDTKSLAEFSESLAKDSNIDGIFAMLNENQNATLQEALGEAMHARGGGSGGGGADAGPAMGAAAGGGGRGGGAAAARGVPKIDTLNIVAEVLRENKVPEAEEFLHTVRTSGLGGVLAAAAASGATSATAAPAPAPAAASLAASAPAAPSAPAPSASSASAASKDLRDRLARLDAELDTL